MPARFRCHKYTTAKRATAAIPVVGKGINAKTVAAAKSSLSIKLVRA
jgi:hypothetical protein